MLEATILKQRLAGLQTDLKNAENLSGWQQRLVEPVDERFKAVADFWDAAIKDVHTRAAEQQRAVSNKLLALDGPNVDEALVRQTWQEYGALYEASQAIFRDCLAVVSGLAFRLRLSEVAIWEMADRLVLNLSKEAGLSLTLPAPEQTMNSSAQRRAAGKPWRDSPACAFLTGRSGPCPWLLMNTAGWRPSNTWSTKGVNRQHACAQYWKTRQSDSRRPGRTWQFLRQTGRRTSSRRPASASPDDRGRGRRSSARYWPMHLLHTHSGEAIEPENTAMIETIIPTLHVVFYDNFFGAEYPIDSNVDGWLTAQEWEQSWRKAIAGDNDGKLPVPPGVMATRKVRDILTMRFGSTSPCSTD